MRVLVVDDHETVRRGVCSILEARKDIEICGEASNGQEAVEKTSELKPDLIVLDVTCPSLMVFPPLGKSEQFSPKFRSFNPSGPLVQVVSNAETCAFSVVAP